MKARKPLRNGRDNRGGHCTVLLRDTLHSPAWAALSTAAQALYPFLRLEWKGDKANNNGKISLSVRQAGVLMGVQPDTAARAFHDLQAKGFIVVTELACLGVEGYGRSAAYELTELAMPGKGHEGRKLYRQWRKDHDFPVARHPTNNPTGRNGENRIPSRKARRPHHENSDVPAEPVMKSATPHHENRDDGRAGESNAVIKIGTPLITIPGASANDAMTPADTSAGPSRRTRQMASGKRT